VRAHGFTLLELLLVLAIVAIGSAGVIFTLRDSGQAALRIEAQRLAAVLDSARVQARAMGRPVRWQAVEGGFLLEGLPGVQGIQRWQIKGITARSSQADGMVELGAEPIMVPQSVRLWQRDQPQTTAQISTDGVHPFVLNP
jgi:general secretion pathway protein H